MKTTKLLLAAAATIVSLSAWANPLDLTAGGVDFQGRHHHYGSSSSNEGWHTIYGSLDTQPRILGATEDFDFDSGYSVGFSVGTPVQGDMPLFVEYGIEFASANKSQEEKYSYEGYNISLTEDVNYTYIAVPVNVVFQYQLNRRIAIAPYAGFNLKYGLTFEEQCVAQADDERIKTTTDYYDDEDMDDGALKRTLIGNQYGVNIIIGNRLQVGVKYQKDLSELRDKLTFESNLSLTAAIRF